jgi:Na+/proline symporter
MLSRVVVFISGVLAIILAYVAQETIFWLVLFAWGGLGASFGTSLIFSLYWKRTGKYGIFAGMVVGTVVTIVWKLYLKETTGIYELIPAFFGSALAIFLVSLLTRKKNN